MSLQLVIRPDAEDELTAAHDWYESQQAGVGDDFLRAADAVFVRITAQPELYAAGYRGARQAPIHRFPYVVVYRIVGTTIDVFAVVHTKPAPTVVAGSPLTRRPALQSQPVAGPRPAPITGVAAGSNQLFYESVTCFRGSTPLRRKQ
ncbi:type II toxin-antitoxin system RelE/ParE family toxin [Urbifossiella limnaea]|uniref:Plasmid stabilization system protein n=1 Tax=Urbifossiella limnaea TaxID=2528023 RepID=A0A517Y0M9_9BACT|nr:type II toxin-antitoxin system RelE/ParE family toxin [Urbifossiella limnaea]QDU23322.1 Plasmid stabilization system protein [Urbifossiella limnaea]